MKRIAASCVAVLGALVVLGAAFPAAGQSNVKVVLSEVVDDRISGGMGAGGLVLELNLAGDGLDSVKSARIRLKEAKDDTGKSLLDPKASAPDFTDRNVNAGRIQVSLEGPPRSATSLRVSGTVDLFVPGRDPASTVKVPGFQSALDKPLAAKGLKAAKVEVTVLSKARYAAERKKMRIDEKKIEEIRAEGKARGVKQEEIDAVIEMAKAFDQMGESDAPENALFLQIPKASDEKIQELRLETAAGEKIDTAGSSSRSDGDVVVKQIELKEAPPKDAVLAFSLFSDKSIVSVPFEMKEVPLP